jgi:hypothetical protein
MTPQELQALIRQAVKDVLQEMLEADDPDAGLEFRPEIAARLERFMAEKPVGQPGEDVLRELGLDD